MASKNPSRRRFDENPFAPKTWQDKPKGCQTRNGRGEYCVKPNGHEGPHKVNKEARVLNGISKTPVKKTQKITKWKSVW